MSQTPKFETRPSGDVMRLHTDSYLNEIVDGMAQEAFEKCAPATPSDHETRQISMLEVRAIRSLRSPSRRARASVLHAAAGPRILNGYNRSLLRALFLQGFRWGLLAKI